MLQATTLIESLSTENDMKDSSLATGLGANKVRPPFSSEKHRKSERMQLKEMVIYFAE